MTQTIALDDLRTVDQLAAARPDVLTSASIKWQMRHRETNGLDQACVRIGKKILLSQSRYESWLATQAGRHA